MAYLINSWTLRRHHPVDPVRIEEGLIDDWRLVAELTIHRKVVTPLQRYGPSCSNFFSSNSYADTHLAGHRRSADDGLVELQNLDHFSDASNITFLGIRVVSGYVVLTWEASAVGRQVEGVHGTFFHHPRVVHDTMVLATVAARCVTEYNFLLSISTLLVKYLCSSPNRRVDVDITSYYMVFIHLWLDLLFHRAMESIA